MPIDVSFLAPPPIKSNPPIPQGKGYRYDPVDYEVSEWVLTYQYTYEDEVQTRIVFKDLYGGTHVRMVFKDPTMKDF
jgi:hypothetical protein